MRQKQFSESSKHILVVTILSFNTIFPIKVPHLQFITSSHLRQGDTTLLRPLSFSKHQCLITTICLHALPSGNTITIRISLRRDTLKYLFFQPRCARGLYYVVHNVILILFEGEIPLITLFLFFQSLRFVKAAEPSASFIFIHSFVPSVESGIAERSGAENEPRNILCPFSLAQRKERKETSTPTKSPPILGDLTEEWQRPLILRSFWYRGTRDGFLYKLRVRTP